ncbi:transmembrane sensor [Pedobacter africanus]|uniref:Ferric-dicitrate binding protein FerR (Iron transport regulator) n=1 Tax=Pedobacter africanus TaxID=151894 RepID=A0ACC6KXT3_9SPHI|nr:FecR domain-containing protein [Pedobacter africanus]MDR6783981.1 ferric-dicitrate binding protein FerR (iron transport regulator) [Pedobacter africanus]
MQNREAKELLKKYREGSCTAEEIALLESWYLEYEDETKPDFTPEAIAEEKSRIWQSLPVHQKQVKRMVLWPWIAAASVILCVTLALLFQKKDKQAADTATVKILPGGNNAILTLANGSKISLNDAANGNLASQSGITVTKTSDGQLVYQVGISAKETRVVEYNTVTTPKGGQYQVNLPDGTKVWLNAASSLTFPVAFAASERQVKLTGEAYFEVAHNKEKPFKVSSDKQNVTVLGTHFNVSAYKDDDEIRTTLLEGKVKVQLSEIDASAVLRPGEQGVLKGRTFNTRFVNTENEIAWVNNAFVFDNEELGSIMRKIARWYDVEVVCPEELEKMEFSGTGSRSKSIQNALKIMELTESVHFKFEGRRITVMP